MVPKAAVFGWVVAAAILGCGKAQILEAASAPQCTTCHSVTGGGAVRSAHVMRASALAECPQCHDDAQRQQGAHYKLPRQDAAFPNAWCTSCHSGRGRAVGGRTPPLLLGWSDAAAGDFHGARAGAGFSGTLAAPWATGQGPLPCTACHASHTSDNAFLLASTVNGRPVAAASIDRIGVGGEALCDACHEGEHHAGCSTAGCHASDPQPPGSACFSCHGHEGIRYWTAPNPSMDGTTGCEHCHASWFRTPDHVPPAFATTPTASSLTATTATVRWSTDEGATSYVEYGVGAADWVDGNTTLVGSHVVTLTGLAPATTYVWRVRSSDAFRNVAESALRSFTTYAADALPAPDLATVSAGATVPDTSTVATLLWYPVTAPSGAAVTYEVQLASDPGFTVLTNSTLAAVDATLATGNSGWIAGTATHDTSAPARAALGFDVTLTNLPQDVCAEIQQNVYYFRVRARDANGNVSEWSATGTFGVWAADPYC
jgi:predicted CXXCH cytochrome family protein